MSYDEAHEDRIQQLERDGLSAGAQLSAVNVTLTYMQKALGDIGDKIDIMMVPITSRLNVFEERMDGHSNVIGDLKRSEDIRKDRKSAFKKVLLGLVVAGAGVAGKELVVFFWHIFTKAV